MSPRSSDLRFQGEGPSLGRRAFFLRLGGCNLACGWCDTYYTWDSSRVTLRDQLHRMTLDEVVGELQRIGYTANDLLVISGGEPMLQQDRVVQLFYLLNQNVATFVSDRRQVEIETNGTIEPSYELLGLRGLWFNVSPKLRSSIQLRPVHRVTPALASYAATWRARFKFVITSEVDLEEVRELVQHLPYVEKSRIWVMPEGTNAEVIGERLKWLAPMALEYGWNLTTRLHTMIWNDERGK